MSDETIEDIAALLAQQRELIERGIQYRNMQHAQIQAVLALCQTWLDIPATASSTVFAQHVLECLAVSS